MVLGMQNGLFCAKYDEWPDSSPPRAILRADQLGGLGSGPDKGAKQLVPALHSTELSCG